MGTNNSIISKTDLDIILSRRVVLNHEDLRDSPVFGRIINHALDLGNSSRNSNTYVGDLIFTGCTFNEAVNIGGSDNSNIIFKKCLFNCYVNVISNAVRFEDDCYFKGDFMVSSYSSGFKKSFSISNITVDGKFEVKGSIENISRINLEKEIQDQTLIVDSELLELHLNNVIFKEIQIKTNKEKSKLKLENLNCRILRLENADTLIEQCKVARVDFATNNIDNKKLHIINESRVEDMIVPLVSFNTIDISDSTFGKLKLCGNNQEKGIVHISKVRIKELEFEDVFNTGLITLRELQIQNGGLVSIRSSNLGKTDFIYCNFQKGKLEFENSRITEAFFSESDFPKVIYGGEEKNYSQAQLAFGQLTTAFQKQGDMVRMLEYNARELHAHYYTLKWFSKEFFKKFNLWLNLISNNFGRYWIRGVIFSFGVGLLFFCALLISTDKFEFGIPSFHKELIPSFLRFMNPLRFVGTEDLFKESHLRLTPWSHVWDFLGRVFVAYGFYQTIQAFRRYGRK